MRPSLMNTKGWHYDTTDEQIEAAYQLLVTLNKTKYNIGYRERPDTLGGERQFHLTVPSQPTATLSNIIFIKNILFLLGILPQTLIT